MSPPRTTMPPSSMSTVVLIVRLLVTRSTAPAGFWPMLELSIESFSITELPSAEMVGVTLRIVPTSWRWMVWNGLTTPEVPVAVAAVFVNWPVTNGTSCATFTSASWLSMVTAEGVATTLVFVSPRIARSMAAKFTPVPAMPPMPTVVPCSRGVDAAWGGRGEAGDLLLELGGDLPGVGVVQVAHPRVAARLQRGVEVRNQCPQPQPLRLLAGDQHAV